MITRENVIKMMQEALDSLHRGGIIENKLDLVAETPIFGAGSNLDSMGFVTFITDVEDRLNQIENKDVFIVLSDLEELYPGAPALTAGMLGEYLVRIVND